VGDQPDAAEGDGRRGERAGRTIASADAAYACWVVRTEDGLEANRRRTKYCLEDRCVRTICVEATNERSSRISGTSNRA
jgi:hypothetical protein